MYYPIKYGKIAHQLYAVYCFDKFVGEVRLVDGAWRFRTFYEPVFFSPIPAPTRTLAVAQWPGLSALCD